MIPLTPAQDEALTIVEEECAELIQAIAKARRFGLTAASPLSGITNKYAIECEAGDVISAIDLATANGLDVDAIQRNRAAKPAQRAPWLRHARFKDQP